MFPDVPLLGLSATNIRYLDNQRDMADELFGSNIASEMTLGEAIVCGILAVPKYVISIYSYQKDLERYQKRVQRTKSKAARDAAEVYLSALRRVLAKSDGLEEVFHRHMPDKSGKYIVFCSNVDHMNEMLERMPGWCAKIDNDPHIYKAYSDDPETSTAFATFKSDTSEHLKLLFCIDMLNEGIHVDDITGVILFRPTISPIIYKQQIGRALSAGKNDTPVIFDIVNNFENLYNIGVIEEEMKEAITYYHSLGNDEEIVRERFQIIDDMRDCRQLFDDLNETLSASWDLMYEQAKRYFEEHGNLNVPKRFKTPEGYSLGSWIMTQRKVRAGLQYGNLSESCIRRLDDIGMIWENRYDLNWEKNFAEAKRYYETHGNLDVNVDCVTESGMRLGTWICNLRQYRSGNVRNTFLTQERIVALDRIGMIWDKFSYLWEQQYLACMEYYTKHGNLDIPINYISPSGLRTGEWIRRMRAIRSGKT